MRAFLTMAALSLSVGGLTACSTSTQLPIEDTAFSASPSRASEEKKVEILADTSEETATTSAAETSATFARNAINDPTGPLNRKTIYFDYNESQILPEYMDIVANHARYLIDYPDVRVRLEGHTDERASREYNIALGERRAAGVRRLLLLQGANVEQIDTISYGEEKPAQLGHDEESWMLNRRVEFIYLAP